MADWLSAALVTLPVYLWMFIGIGLPWALVILPRRDWRQRALVACVMLGVGPASLTAWMLFLGVLGQDHNPNPADAIDPMHSLVSLHVGGHPYLTAANILIGTVFIALIGVILAWRKCQRTAHSTLSDDPIRSLDGLERLLVGLIIVATMPRWILTVWLPFGSYDPLWVYAYQGRLYTLIGYIPADIGYYPQFLPLQYAYGQIMYGGINDHAARAVLPFLQLGSILAVYVLGSRLFYRRVGIIAAAIWALYPHFGYWTRVGDLEIVLTFAFTGAAAFFLMAWTEPGMLRRRYALIAGMFLGIALWTKPTAGGMIWGVVLVVVVAFFLLRDWRAWWPRFEVAALMGLASMPLGGVWYLRNALLGHEIIRLPPSYWLDEAMRSGQEFAWPLIALALLLILVFYNKPRPDWRGTVAGVVLVAAGVLPTILTPARMQVFEWAALTTGVVVLLVTMLHFLWRHPLAAQRREQLNRVGWALLLALPYFVTWFYSYSYHYRLSFAIVPLMILPSAVMLAMIFSPERLARWTGTLRRGFYGGLVLVVLPSIFIVMYDETVGWDWWWNMPEEDDYTANGLLQVVDYLREEAATQSEPPVIYAPGQQTLPFYFPLWEIHVEETPRELETIAGAEYFLDSSSARLYYTPGGFQNPVYTNLFRENAATKVVMAHDPLSFYDLYTLHLEDRFVLPEIPLVAPDGDLVFGDFARLVGVSAEPDTFPPDGTAPVEFVLLWEVLAPVDRDYMLYMHLVNEDCPDIICATRDGPVNKPYGWTMNYYSTLFWEPGEYIIDHRAFFQVGSPEGDGYRVRIGFYHLETGERVPITLDDEAIGDGYTLPLEFSVAE